VPATFCGPKLPFVVLLPFDLHGVDGFDVAVGVAFKFRRGGEIGARIGAEFRGGFFLAVIHLERLRPFRPRIVLGAFERRLGHDFQLHHALAAVADGSADAVRAGVAAADDDDILAVGGDVACRASAPSSRLLVFAVRNSIAKWMPFKFAAWNRQVAALVAPVARITASNSCSSFSAG
jgi:hypothetical protein